MNKLCTQTVGGMVKPRKHEQRLLRNVGVHIVVLDLLQIPYDKKEDTRMNSLMRQAHEFLQNFCLGNQQNQVLLHKQLDLFLNPGVSRLVSCVHIKSSNFSENYKLLTILGDKNGNIQVVWGVVLCCFSISYLCL
jgi:inositol 1,4,5-triphosphate receptor type 1